MERPEKQQKSRPLPSSPSSGRRLIGSLRSSPTQFCQDCIDERLVPVAQDAEIISEHQHQKQQER